MPALTTDGLRTREWSWWSNTRWWPIPAQCMKQFSCNSTTILVRYHLLLLQKTAPVYPFWVTQTVTNPVVVILSTWFHSGWRHPLQGNMLRSVAALRHPHFITDQTLKNIWIDQLLSGQWGRLNDQPSPVSVQAATLLATNFNSGLSHQNHQAEWTVHDSMRCPNTVLRFRFWIIDPASGVLAQQSEIQVRSRFLVHHWSHHFEVIWALCAPAYPFVQSAIFWRIAPINFMQSIIDLPSFPPKFHQELCGWSALKWWIFAMSKSALCKIGYKSWTQRWNPSLFSD